MRIKQEEYENQLLHQTTFLDDRKVGYGPNDASVAGCASYDVRFHRREPVAIVGAEKYDPWGVYHGVTVISLLWVPFVQKVELLSGGGRQTAVNC